MQIFTDTTGYKWELALDYGAIKRLRADVAVDLLLPQEPRQDAPAAANGKPLPLATEINIDPVLAIDVVFSLLREQAEKRGLDDYGFARALGPEGGYDAHQALVLEWAAFFRQTHREDLARVVEANSRTITAQIARTAEMIPEAERLVGQKMEALKTETMAELGKIETSTNSPASPE